MTLSHDRLIWGWVRLLLGMAQIILATMALMTLLTLGLAPLTWVFIGGATAATIISRHNLMRAAALHG